MRTLIRPGIILLLALTALGAALLPSPRQAAASGVAAIAAGDLHNCAVTPVGGIKCWGYNGTGALGDGTLFDRWTPVEVCASGSGGTCSPLSGAVAVAASIAFGGSNHTCALTTAGGLKCWGLNASGQLGAVTTGRCGDLSCSTTPVDVSGLVGGVAAIAVGGSHTCALTTAGGLKCWGYNGWGELGDGTTIQRTTPVDVAGLTSGLVSIAAGKEHTCALTAAGGVKCWGNNEWGQVGDGTAGDGNVFTSDNIRTTPVDVVGLTSGVAAVSAGGSHTCAITMAGQVKCWGNNEIGQLGDGTSGVSSIRSTPVDVVGLTSGVVAVTAGATHTCAITAGGGAECWGRNDGGALGDGTTTHRNAPVDVSGLTTGVAAIAAGRAHTCVLTAAGGVKCWGGNKRGVLGVGGTVGSTNVPMDVVGLGPKAPKRAIVFIQGITSTSSCQDTDVPPDGEDGFLDKAPRWINSYLQNEPLTAGGRASVSGFFYFSYSDGVDSDGPGPDSNRKYCDGGTGENGATPEYVPADTCNRSIDGENSYYEELRTLIQRITDNTPGTKVTIVAHSQGGLIASYLVGHLRRVEPQFVKDRIASVITFDSFPEGLPFVSEELVQLFGYRDVCGSNPPSVEDWGSGTPVGQDADDAARRFPDGTYQVAFYTLEADCCLTDPPQIPSNLTDIWDERLHEVIPGDDHTTIWDRESLRKQQLVACAVMLVDSCEITNWHGVDSIMQGETRFASAGVPAGSPRAGFVISFGSIVRLTPVTPSGVRIDSFNLPPGAEHRVGPNFESYEFTDPEPGTWGLEVFVEQASPEGAQVTLLMDVAAASPVGVGGIAELADIATLPAERSQPSGANALFVAGVIAAVAAGAIAVGGVAWYVRRGWHR